MSLSFSRLLLSFVLLILFGWALGNFYGYLGGLLDPPWLPIALLHTLLALLILRFGPAKISPKGRAWLAFIPTLLILFGSLLLGLGSRLLMGPPPPTDAAFDISLLAFILWIPIIEECVFRLGIGGWLRQKLGILWGHYGSALVFALAHGGISSRWPEIAPGPLMLGLCCEWIYIRTGRLTAVIAFHAACNASSWIFSALDPRWLQWLQDLYLRV